MSGTRKGFVSHPSISLRSAVLYFPFKLPYALITLIGDICRSILRHGKILAKNCRMPRDIASNQLTRRRAARCETYKQDWFANRRQDDCNRSMNTRWYQCGCSGSYVYWNHPRTMILYGNTRVLQQFRLRCLSILAVQKWIVGFSLVTPC